MKKMLIALTLIALAVSAQAGLLTDPDFTVGTSTATNANDFNWSDGSNRLKADDGLDDWQAMKIGNPSTWRWNYDAANDKVVYAQIGTAVNGFGQIVTLAGTESGNWTFTMDYSVLVDADGDVDVEGVTVLGLRDGTSIAGAYMDFNTKDLLEGTSDYTADTLLGPTDFNPIVGVSTNYSATINLGTAGTYDYLMVRVGFRTGDLTDQIEVTNVDIVPEPATVGMLGLGALVSLLVRRIRA